MILTEALQSKRAKPQGIWTASKDSVALSPDAPSDVSIGEPLGNPVQAGLEGLGYFFNGMQQGMSNLPEQVEKALNSSAGKGNFGAYIDPQLQQELANESVRERLQNLTRDPKLLMKTIQENPLVKQFAEANPMFRDVIQNVQAMQQIFKPELLAKIAKGDAPSDASMEELLSGSTSEGLATTAPPAAAVQQGNASRRILNLEDGLMIREVRPGNGKMFPKAGDRVFVHYTGYLKDGTAFDSSRNRGLFSFMMGASEVIRGWEVALLHMSLGERAVLQVPSQMAYGSTGLGPIPPNSDLVFDIDVRGINAAEA
eukprot:TRINITY_DN24683_c0_g1_i1.p1 TRINITY_DN24683_c0_g1~~TRINITY_DN24683_c0_g1_i1.p1  ORF type:complete len:357 (+),score=105.28 TRINITY_DN24683_c0_g1_i1:133-1071(+)